MRLCVALLLVLASSPARAFEESVRRELVDAGVHVPVLTRAPELLEFVEAAYPHAERSSGKEAAVTFQLTIGADGAVAAATVSSSGGAAFDEAALAAVQKFKFRPAEVDNVPAAVQVEYVYHFVLRVEVDAGTPQPPPPPKGHIRGRVTARGSRARVLGASVSCRQAPDDFVLTDEDGQFDLEANVGPCGLKLVARGFETLDDALAVDAATPLEKTYAMVRTGREYEALVKGEREKKEVVRRTLQREELQKIPGTFGDPVRVVQNFPGVARAPFLGGQLIVRGASPDQTLTFFDGVEIPILYHLGGGPSVVNSEFLDRIDFFPGGFGARYGRAVGGVVDVATRTGASDAVHGVAKVDIQDASLFAEAPLTDGVSIAAAVRRSYIDVLLPLVLPKDPEGGSLLVLPRYWDYSVRIDQGAKRGEVKADGAVTSSLMAFGSDDTLKLVATGGGRERDVNVDFHTLFHRLVGGFTARSGNTTFRLTPYAGYDLAAIQFGGASIRADEFEAGLRSDVGVELNDWFTFRFGLDALFDHIHGVAELPVLDGTQFVSFPGADQKSQTQRISRDLDSFDGAAYVEADFKVGAFTFTPGLRLSHAFLDNQTRHAFDPRLWVRYDLFEGTQLKGSVGLYTQPPAAQNMEPPPLGTPTLTHEKAFQTSLGVSQKLTKYLNIDVTGFFNRRFENVVSPGPTTVNADGSVTRERFSNDGLGRAYGLEVMLKHDVSDRFFGWVAYTFNRSEERRVGGDDYVLTSWDQTHILTLVGSVKLFWGLELGARFRYVTGRPKTPLVHDGDLYAVDANRFNSQQGVFRSARLKPFHQLDLRVDKNFVFNAWTLTAFLDVQNVYNAKNVEATFYDYRFRQEYEVPGIPVLPVIGLKGSF